MLLLNSGLNLQFIFNIDGLPAEMCAALESQGSDLGAYRQLILIGHGGRALWHELQKSGIESDDPVDDFTIRNIEHYFSAHLSGNSYRIIYPGEHPVSLQRLGKLAGWHHPSPFMVGINEKWGSWYAYRAVILADTNFEPSTASGSDSPCDHCGTKQCVSICPGAALEGAAFDLQRCIGYRKQAESKCRDRCLSRISCPVATHHRYSDEQIQYHYTVSMKSIEALY